jgi:uncharacterized SAM-binding protein YcdF (DUF218 family)
MFYDFLRSLAPLAHPLGLLWLALICGTIFAARKRRLRLSVILGMVTLLLTLAGSRLPIYLVTGLESPFILQDPQSLPECDAVVMLGGCLEVSKNDLAGFNLNDAADRITTAIEMVRLKKAGVLVLGGSGPVDAADGPSQAEVLKRWLDLWQLPGVPVRALDTCFSTHDEAMKVQALAAEQGWKRILLVTSAAHLRRAEAVFRKAGLDVVPVGCDFTRLGTPYRAGFNPIPRLNGFKYLDVYLHEQIGWQVYRWRGWI